MTSRYTACALAALTLSAAAALAQDDAGTESRDFENANMAFIGNVTADALAHSGPSLNDYAVVKLRKDQKVVVVGIKLDWLKIQPPEDAFCLMQTANVETRADGKIGRVIRKASVRVGSTIVGDWSRAATQLEGGTDVQILERTGQWFKIKPPKGVYIYVEKKSVLPERKLELAADGTPIVGETVVQKTDSKQPPSEQGPGDVDNGGIANGGTPPVADPTTKPTDAAAPAFDVAKVEAFDQAYTQGMSLPLADRPTEALLASAAELMTLPNIPAPAKSRLQVQQQNLQKDKKQLESQTAFAKQQAEFATKARELSAEQEELEARLSAAPTRYAVIGKLTQSNLQIGKQTLYRLVDPGTGRTLIYLRSSDTSVLPLLDQLVGVKGQIVDDTASKLKYVQQQVVEPVSADQVGRKVFADLTPPSLLQGLTAASPQ